jgi:hypothetical protein
MQPNVADGVACKIQKLKELVLTERVRDCKRSFGRNAIAVIAGFVP